ncbi:GNAT family N-acetyltransferase [Bacillus salitolerans]|uniref:GNAT family N-acetyltransferase n=1 Tax=Bacillus salitolerans TaxID=1437434 RepID=A0ABW4LX79_9BACI
MRDVSIALLNDLEKVVEIDKEVIGNDSRKGYIKKAMEEKRCIVVKERNSITGFLTYNTHFFESSFISLIIVNPLERRKGYATSLLTYFIENAPTFKIFSSTNQSNQTMKEVFKQNGFVQSGYVDNLDEGDPEIIYFRRRIGD